MLTHISKTQKITVMIGVMLAMFLSALDQTIVATAMPKIVKDLNGLEHLTWVFTSYMLASTVIVPIYGKLSDLYGRKYFILAAIAIFLIGSALSGAAQNMMQLIFFRAIQGIGGGAIFANAFATIGDLFVPTERGKWQGLLGAVFGVSSVVGPTLGGWLTDSISWRWNFFINIPIGILAFVAIWFLMPHIVPKGRNKSIDYTGALLLTIGLITLLLGFVWGGNQYAWNSWQIIGLLGGALVSLTAFILVELRAKEAILPPSLFKNSIFSVSMIITFLTGIAMFGSIIYIPLFAQLVLGLSATNSGTILTPLMLGMVGSSMITGQVISHTGKYKLLAIVALGLTSLALYYLSTISVSTTEGDLITRMIALGIGLGMSFPIFTIVVQNALDHSMIGVATSSIQMFRSVGATIGTAILGSVMNNALSNKLADLSSDQFVRNISQVSSTLNLQHANMDTLQNLLSKDGQLLIQTKLAELPSSIQTQANQAFMEFILKIKTAFANSLMEVFLLSTLMALIAFIAAFFLKEIPLKKEPKTPLTEKAGKELAMEEGTFPASSEIDLTR